MQKEPSQKSVNCSDDKKEKIKKVNIDEGFEKKYLNREAWIIELLKDLENINIH